MVFCNDKDSEFFESENQKDQMQRNFLLTAVEQTSDSILITDKDHFIRYVNPTFENITGFFRQEITGKKLDTVWDFSTREVFSGHLLEELEQNDSWKGRITWKKKDGSLYESESVISIVRDSSGNIQGYVIISRDVTREAKLEKHLIQTQKLQAIGTLAGGIAHDFNNILSAIMGYTEICMLQASQDPQIPRRLGRVMHACQRARELVKQILTFSRQTHQEKGRIQIHLIVKEALKLLRASLPSTIEIRQKIQTDSSYIMADPAQIHQILINLCTNAAQAMKPTGGVLSVSVEDVVIDDNFIEKYNDLTPGHYVRLTVSDNGHGMDPEIMHSIFDPFFTTQESDKNNGLGLDVVQRIVKNHGGTIYVDSQLDKGSVFEVFFPVSTGELMTERSSPMQLPGGNERILLLDDEEDIVQMAKEMLESLGYSVKYTVNSPEALGWFDQAPDQYDLVITDQTMPRMTGLELAERVTNIRPDIPVILCTGFSEDLLPGITESPHIRHIIMKPFIMQELAGTIRKVLDNR